MGHSCADRRTWERKQLNGTSSEFAKFGHVFLYHNFSKEEYLGCIHSNCMNFFFVLLTEVRDYAVKIGINPESEPHLLHFARDGLMQALPAGWKPW